MYCLATLAVIDDRALESGYLHRWLRPSAAHGHVVNVHPSVVAHTSMPTSNPSLSTFSKMAPCPKFIARPPTYPLPAHLTTRQLMLSNTPYNTPPFASLDAEGNVVKSRTTQTGKCDHADVGKNTTPLGEGETNLSNEGTVWLITPQIRYSC